MAIRRLLLVALLLGTPGVAHAGNLVELSIDRTTARAGSTLELTVRAQGPRCGVRIRTGDGQRFDIAVKGQRVLPLSYPTAGSYTLDAVPRQKNHHPKCDGAVPALQVTIEPPLVLERSQQRPGLTSVPGGPSVGKPKGPGSGATSSASDPGASETAGPKVKLPEFAITSVGVTPYADIADVRIGLSLAKADKVEMWLRRNGETVKRQWFNVTDGQTLGLDALVPGAEHELRVRATKAQVVSETTRSFRAKRKQLEMIITSIFAVDDGDDFDAGDFEFRFRELDHDLELHFFHDISTGTGVDEEHRMTIPNVIGFRERISTEVIEDDDSMNTHWGSASAAVREFQLSGLDPRQGGTLPFTWTYEGNDENYFRIEIRGRAEVRYE